MPDHDSKLPRSRWRPAPARDDPIASARAGLRRCLTRLFGRRLRLARRPLEASATTSDRCASLRTRWRLSAPELCPCSRVIATFECSDGRPCRLSELILRGPPRGVGSGSPASAAQLRARAQDLAARLGLELGDVEGDEEGGERCRAGSPPPARFSIKGDGVSSPGVIGLAADGSLLRLRLPAAPDAGRRGEGASCLGDRLRARLCRERLLTPAAARELPTLPGQGARGPSCLAVLERPEGLLLVELEGTELRQWWLNPESLSESW